MTAAATVLELLLWIALAAATWDAVINGYFWATIAVGAPSAHDGRHRRAAEGE